MTRLPRGGYSGAPSEDDRYLPAFAPSPHVLTLWGATWLYASDLLGITATLKLYGAAGAACARACEANKVTAAATSMHRRIIMVFFAALMHGFSSLRTL
ncbi:hypothetical protein C3Z06_20875 [Cupriavidus metallidurans]|nr:hypothetical protein C3Z06_20875 [Cupriavidus metallidurans]